MPRFSMTFCSQCGRPLGPADHGASHCIAHSARTISLCDLVAFLRARAADPRHAECDDVADIFEAAAVGRGDFDDWLAERDEPAPEVAA